MLSSECSSETDNLLIAEFGNWRVRELQLDKDKTLWLWSEMNKYKSLFSDLTRGDIQNFINILVQRDSYWMEAVDENDRMVGLLYVTQLSRTIDCEVHLIFFDRKPAEKVFLCKQVVKWIFERFPLRRMTATIPSIYYRTIKLAHSVGFKEEGRKRESQLMGNKWVDEVILGILRSEVV